MSALLEINCCIDCPYHTVQEDPDPYDWFCRDDVKVKCEKARNQTPRRNARGNIMAGEPYATVACRPYQIRNETTPIPDWCPLART